MKKAPDAFRTISEVSDWLETPAHVLRFWESKFSQIKPVKRAGGRRYYRPDDMRLLGGIKQMLHIDGLTIKGAQKVLREKGIKHVLALSPNVATSGPEQKSSIDVLADEINKNVSDVANAPAAPLVLEPASLTPTEPAVDPAPTPVSEPPAAAAAFFAQDNSDTQEVDAKAETDTAPQVTDKVQDMTDSQDPLDTATAQINETPPVLDSENPASAKSEDISELYGRLKSLRRRMKDAQ